MMMRYWNPSHDALAHTMDRMLSSLFDSDDYAHSTTWTPAISLVEHPDTFELECFIPGVSGDDVDIQVSKDSVLLSGLRTQTELPDEHERLYSDIRYGQFRRFIELPSEIRQAEATADYRDGVLVLTLPKVEDAKTQVVKLSLNESATHQLSASEIEKTA